MICTVVGECRACRAARGSRLATRFTASTAGSTSWASRLRSTACVRMRHSTT